MDDQVLPLDLTIYGAVHQQEMRKKEKSGVPMVPAMFWQGVYTVKFKKVPGSADSKLAILVRFFGTDRSPSSLRDL